MTRSSDAAQPGALPDASGGPYPFITFAHGFGGDPEVYAGLLRHWAANGFVVAAPRFPLSSGASPCGSVAGDSVNQPEDISFVISSVLKEAAGGTGPLAGLVDRHKVGAAGHSNGGITMYGLVANTALRDPRVKAVAVLVGTPQRYPKGRYDFAKAPPMLLVHGDADELVPYELGVGAFNRARGPKGLLTIAGGAHGSAAALSSPAAAPQVLTATADFFDAYLRGDSAAKGRLPDDQLPGVTTMKFVAEPGSTTTIPTLPTPKLHLKASATPTKKPHEWAAGHCHVERVLAGEGDQHPGVQRRRPCADQWRCMRLPARVSAQTEPDRSRIDAAPDRCRTGRGRHLRREASRLLHHREQRELVGSQDVA